MKKSDYLLQQSPCQMAQVRFVRFSTFTKHQIESNSVAEITQPQLYEGDRPLRGGPNDLRLGVNSMNYPCQTCGQTRECQGHFGHIKLVEPVFHYGFMEYVLKILKCICHNCSKLKLFMTEQQRQKFKKIILISNPLKRLKQLSKLLGPVSKCPMSEQKDAKVGCGSVIPTRIMIKQHKIVIQQKSGNKIRQYNYNAREVHNLFAKINQIDCKLLGFTQTKPVDLIVSTLAVAPPQVRPSIQMNPDKKAEDDITFTYTRILAINKQLKSHVSLTQKASKIEDIQKFIAAIMVKVDRLTINTVELKTGKNRKKTFKIKSIQERLKSKEGRFRQHLMGKRVDFSARSVISPDANLALDQLGVPQKIARLLTIPQEITQWNFQRILNLCKTGMVKYILKPTSQKKKYEDFIHISKISQGTQELQKYLNYGTIVERCLQNGDYVIFNRQPTLHRMSMMAHRIKILPYSTFRLNLSVCTPYNADFDGDEMNMHVPQSIQTVAELKHIAHVSKQVIAPKSNSPIMGMVQDSLLGIYLLTMRDTFLTRAEIMNLVLWIQPCIKMNLYQLPCPAIIKPEHMWTGKQVMSLLIPKQISINIVRDKDYLRNREQKSMIIRSGELISGALQKEVVGSGAGGLVHSIWIQFGADATSQFITNAQRVANNWLMTNTFSVGVQDIVTDSQLEEKRAEKIASIKQIYYQTINKYRDPEIIKRQNLHQKGKRIEDSLEYKINIELNNHLSDMQKTIPQKISPTKNNIYKMILAKSKGTQTNLAQMLLFLGNQNVEGQRCPLGFYKRALPHFCKNDNSPQPRGFVFSSFYKGLKPHEFFFHSMGGRQGLSDTAVKTSNIGYIQRKLIKSLQDLSIRYDGSVRDSQNNLLQKLYGQDGFLSQFVQKQKSADCETSEAQFRQKYAWEKRILEQFDFQMYQTRAIAQEYQLLKQCRERLRQLCITGRDEKLIEYYCPINMERIFNKIIKMTVKDIKQMQGQTFYLSNSQKNRTNPYEIIISVQKLLNECITPQTKRQYQNLCQKYQRSKMKYEKIRQFQQDSGMEIFHIHLRLNLASRPLYQKYKFNKKQLELLILMVRDKFRQSIVPAGQPIGAVAAQSIGEPTTQMTLNTFHLAGVSDRNVTLGIPRLRQLLDISKSIKTPYMTIFYKERILNRDKSTPRALFLNQLLSFELPEKYLRDFLSKSKIYYDPNVDDSKIGIPTNFANTKVKLPWVITLTFDSRKVNSKIWKEIFKKLQTTFQGQFQILEMNSRQEGYGLPEVSLRFYENFNNRRGEVPKSRSRSKLMSENELFRQVQAFQGHFKQLFISGLKGIKAVKASKKLIFNIPQSQDLSLFTNEDYEQLVFEAQGTNLKACLSYDLLDSTKTYSNDINEIYEVLGVQAARQAFINQFKQILKPYTIYINHHHLSVLADWITTRGVMTPINRHGINKVRDVSVLRKASFEQSVDVMFRAAVFSEVDELRGVSQRVIFGENIKIGTNCFDVSLDREKAGLIKFKCQNDRVIQRQDNLQQQQAILENTQKMQTPFGFSTPTNNSSRFETYTPSQSFEARHSPLFLTPKRQPDQLFLSSPIRDSHTSTGAQNQVYQYLQRQENRKSPQYVPESFEPYNNIPEPSCYMLNSYSGSQKQLYYSSDWKRKQDITKKQQEDEDDDFYDNN